MYDPLYFPFSNLRSTELIPPDGVRIRTATASFPLMRREFCSKSAGSITMSLCLKHTTPSTPSEPMPENVHSFAFTPAKYEVISLICVRPPRPLTTSWISHVPGRSSLNFAPYVPSAWSSTFEATTYFPSGEHKLTSTTSPPVDLKFPNLSAACTVSVETRLHLTP